MRIGIDISQIVYGTGVSRYIQNLVEVLLKVDKENQYVLFFSSLRGRLDRKLGNTEALKEAETLKTFKFPPVFLDILWNRLHVLSIENLIGKIDVFHSSDWIEPPAKCPKVTTIHDLTPLLFPNETHPKIVAVHKRKLEWVKKESRVIIAVSEATKKDIIKVLGIPEKRIRVIYEGVDRKFKVPARGEARQRRQSSKLKINEIKKKYEIKGDYILAFTGPPRKNLKRLTKAHNILASQYPNIELVIIGSPLNTKYKILNTRYLGFVPQEDLPLLYSGALCFVYPSLYEGFGLPILETMACGCPVVTSNTSSMPEVAGNAAVLVDPMSVESIAGGIRKVLNYHTTGYGKYEELRQKGFEQVKKFSWEKCAKETLGVYQEALFSQSSNPKG